MKTKTAIKLPLTEAEKTALRKHRVKIADILNYAADELEVLLNADKGRVKHIRALAQFQSVPSVGIKFAEDLVFLGYYSLAELKNMDGAKLTDAFERKKGYWIDPCVEDQFRLVVNYANTGDRKKQWWHFTEARKTFREQNGYPATRPKTAWYESQEYKHKSLK